MEQDLTLIKAANKFDSLCSNIVTVQNVWTQSLSNVLNLKNELLKQNIPPALRLKLAVSFSELFRSQADYVAPVQELVRLVTVFKCPLEEKSIALKRLDEENERCKADLQIAIKKLERLYSAEKQWKKDRVLNNWERMFCKASLTRTHGRRWKFVISKVRQRAELGLSVFNPFVLENNEECLEENADLLTNRFTYSSTTLSTTTLFTRGGGGMAGSEGIRSRPTVSIMQSKQSTLTRPNSSTAKDTSTAEEESSESEMEEEEEEEKNTTLREPVEMKNKSVSTEDPEYDKLLRLRVYNPIGLKFNNMEVSCTVSVLGRKQDTAILAGDKTNSFHELQYLFEGPEYKNLGYKRCTVLTDLEEEDEISEQIEVTVHSGEERKIFALSTIPIEDISDSMPTVKLKIDQDSVSPKPFPIFPLEEDVTTPCGYLPIFCVWELKRRLKRKDVAVETDIIELERPEVSEAEEIALADDELEMTDQDNIAEEEGELEITSLTKLSTSPALSKRSVSVMIPTPKPAEQVREEALNTQNELATMAMLHAEEIEKLQLEYEARLEEMSRALEMLRQEKQKPSSSSYQSDADELNMTSHTPISLISCITPEQKLRSRSNIEGHSSASAKIPHVTVRSVTTEPTTNIRSVTKTKQKWGEGLPLNFFDRMNYFAQNSLSKHHDLITRVREEVKRQTEGAMATQHRLSRNVKSADSGIADDVSLPAIFMPNKTGVVYSPKARRYFHPPGCKDPRLSQPPSVFQIASSGQVPVLNLFDLSQRDLVRKDAGWMHKKAKDVTNHQ